MGTPLVTAGDIKKVQAGVGDFSRDQVVELFGEPQESYAEGRVVLYDWEMEQGYYLVGTMAASASGFGVSEHRICLKYSEAGVLERFEHLDSAVFDQDAAANKLIRVWVAEIGGWPEDYPMLWDERGVDLGIDHVQLNPGRREPAQIGVTTKVEIVEILGEPAHIFSGGDEFLFAANDTKFFVPVTGPNPVFTARDISFSQGYGGTPYYFLSTRFDAAGLFQSFEIVEAEAGIGPYGLQTLIESTFSVKRSDVEEIKLVLFHSREDRCEVNPVHGRWGIVVFGSEMIGGAVWNRSRYELVWRYGYEEVKEIRHRGWFGTCVLLDLHNQNTVAFLRYKKDIEMVMVLQRYLSLKDGGE